MKRSLPLLLVLLAGCAGLEKYGLGADSAVGQRLQKVDFDKVGKGVTALRKGVEEISESEEYYIGRAVSAQILARYKPWRNEGANLYAQKVLQTVAMASDRPDTYKGWHVQLLDSDEVNAFAAPGGFVFLTRGMVKRAKTEDELAGVLAHEVAHVVKKHGLKTIQTARLTSAFTLLGSEAAKSYTPQQVQQLTSAFEGAVEDVVNKLVVNGYSRDKEYESDRLGAAYAKAANYDPNALKAFLARLGADDKGGGMFKTHPSSAKRVDELGALSASASHKKPAARQGRFNAALR
ncbi:MAG: M48 family metalloprotease [Elusimicrobiota bacterium]|nr:M48 family metalloprotease [Elusimicrobiota bacterium]